jgi:hypothetical protein
MKGIYRRNDILMIVMMQRICLSERAFVQTTITGPTTLLEFYRAVIDEGLRRRVPHYLPGTNYGDGMDRTVWNTSAARDGGG